MIVVCIAFFGQDSTQNVSVPEATTSAPTTQSAAGSGLTVDPELVRRLLGGEQSTLDAVDETLANMDHATRLLVEESDCSTRTQEAQREVVAGLEKLIEEARKQLVATRGQSSYRRRREGRPSPQESPGAKKGASSGAPGGPPEDGQGPSEDGKGAGKDGDKVKPVRGWGYLPMRDREEIAQGFDEEYMAKYRRQIGRYYRVLAEQGRETTRSTVSPVDDIEEHKRQGE